MEPDDVVVEQKTGAELRALAEDLAFERMVYARVSEALAAKKAQWEAENAGLIAEQAQTRLRIEQLEAQLREQALHEYERTGARKPVLGVTIRLATEVKYDPAEGLAWAVANRHLNLLRLETKAFEQAVKALKPEFVTLVERPQVTIARDLAAALGWQEVVSQPGMAE